VQFKQ